MNITLTQKTLKDLSNRYGSNTASGSEFCIRSFLDCLARGEDVIRETFEEADIECFNSFIEHMIAVDDMEWREVLTLTPARFASLIDLFGQDIEEAEQLKKKVLAAGDFAFLALIESARKTARLKKKRKGSTS